ncbi:MAG: FprA family A-type flavoprotein [Bacteroidales bacterium]
MKKNDPGIVEITRDVKWIGITDYEIRTFDIVMTTEFGTTYNSFFIDAEKKTLIEVAKEKFSGRYLEKLRSVTDPREISYIVLDHTEPDHSGSLRILLEQAPQATVVGSGNAIRYLEDIVNVPFRSLIVKDGDTLDLGNKTLKFISAPNLHWPDSIYTWLEEERILFTCDSFGAHYCTPDIFSRLTDEYLSTYKYYFDVILKPFSKFMLKAIEKAEPLDIEYICPGHGPVHHENLREVIAITRKYAEDYLKLISRSSPIKVLVAYVSAYGYTKEAAELIATGLRESEGLEVDVTDIENISPDELNGKLTVSDALLIGSPTINQNTLPPVYNLFALLNPVRDRGKSAGAFGSFGWSGEAAGIINSNLRSLKLKVMDEPAQFKFSPGGDKESALIEFGRKFAGHILENCKYKNPGE